MSNTFPDSDDPVAVARRVVNDLYQRGDGTHLLRRQSGSFYRWDSACWPELDDADLRAEVYGLLEQAVYERHTKSGIVLEPWKPNRRKVDDVLDALKAVVHVTSAALPPSWLAGGYGDLEPHDVIAMGNGLLHLPTRELHQHTPAFWVHHSLPFDYDPQPPTPTRWMRFMFDLWGDDQSPSTCCRRSLGISSPVTRACRRSSCWSGPSAAARAPSVAS